MTASPPNGAAGTRRTSTGSPAGGGDRRLNSVEILAFLQTAHHFTGKDIYRQRAFELLNEHGYLDNITDPGKGPGIV